MVQYPHLRHGVEVMNMMILSQIEENIYGAHLELLPFPHFIIENFFPDDIYRKIQLFNPYKRNAGTEWISKKESQNLKRQEKSEAIIYTQAAG